MYQNTYGMKNTIPFPITALFLYLASCSIITSLDFILMMSICDQRVSFFCRKYFKRTCLLFWTLLNW
jgi:hypothetical protein